MDLKLKIWMWILPLNTLNLIQKILTKKKIKKYKQLLLQIQVNQIQLIKLLIKLMLKMMIIKNLNSKQLNILMKSN